MKIFSIKAEMRTQWLIGFVTLLLLWKPLEACDRDGFQGQLRIDRIKAADIVLYGALGTYHAEQVSSDRTEFFIKFTKYCVVHNSIVYPALEELLKRTNLVIKEIYVWPECVNDWYIILDNENKFAVVTLKYDSLGNQLVLDQINEESSIHLIEGNNNLVQNIDDLAEETREEEPRLGYRSISSYQCSGIDITTGPTTVKAARAASLERHYSLIVLSFLTIIFHWFDFQELTYL